MMIFMIYDDDDDAVMDNHHLLWSTNYNSFIKELSDIEMRSGGASLRFDEFRLFTKNHPAMLFPAFQMQLALQQKVLGVRFWNFNANRRLKLAKGIYIPIDKFLEMVRRRRMMGWVMVEMLSKMLISLSSPSSSSSSSMSSSSNT